MRRSLHLASALALGLGLAACGGAPPPPASPPPVTQPSAAAAAPSAASADPVASAAPTTSAAPPPPAPSKPLGELEPKCTYPHLDAPPPRPAGGMPRPGASRPGRLDSTPGFDEVHDCADQGMWAGAGVIFNNIHYAFSRDGKTFVACDGSCSLVDVGSGRVTPLPRAKPEGVGEGVPAVQDPAIAARLRKLGKGAPGKFPFADDLGVRWATSSHGDHLTVWLREKTTGAEVPIADFTRDDPKEAYWIFPRALMVSPTGATLAVIVGERPNGQGYETRWKLVHVRPAAARVYRKAAQGAATPAAKAIFENKAKLAGGPP